MYLCPIGFKAFTECSSLGLAREKDFELLLVGFPILILRSFMAATASLLRGSNVLWPGTGIIQSSQLSVPACPKRVPSQSNSFFFSLYLDFITSQNSLTGPPYLKRYRANNEIAHIRSSDENPLETRTLYFLGP